MLLILVLFLVFISVNKTPKPSQVQQSLTPTQSLPTSLPTPTANPTASWKTYTNNDYHFSFKYPSELTLLKDDEQVIDSTDFDGQKIVITQLSTSFTTGKMVQSNDPSIQPTQDISWIMINVIPTNGKTIMQAYDNKQGFGTNTITKVTLHEKYGGADEVASVSNLQSNIRTFRKGAYFFDLSYPPQNGSGEITSAKYLDLILSTFKFTEK